MKWLTRIFAAQRKKQRAMDRKVLFPSIRQHQRSAEQGERAIAMHIAQDPAWRHVDEWIHTESVE